MKHISIIIMIGIVLTITIPTISAYDENINTNLNETKISTENNILSVKENQWMHLKLVVMGNWLNFKNYIINPAI